MDYDNNMMAMDFASVFMVSCNSEPTSDSQWLAHFSVKRVFFSMHTAHLNFAHKKKCVESH
jgi:hypothetical protein